MTFKSIDSFIEYEKIKFEYSFLILYLTNFKICVLKSVLISRK